jgi:hypothetical protein
MRDCKQQYFAIGSVIFGLLRVNTYPDPSPSAKPPPESVGCEPLDYGFTSTRAQCKL